VKSPEATGAALRELVRSGRLDLPLPAAGRTVERFESLWRLGAADLTIGRLAEAHADAIAILAEAGRAAPVGSCLGVWATGGAANRVVLERAGRRLRLSGTKAFCSGATLLDAALVTTERDHDELLVLIDLTLPGIEVDLSGWRTSAMIGTATGAVTFDGVPVDDDAVVGAPGFYLRRRGFWYGAIGVAAVWAGGGDAIADALRSSASDAARTPGGNADPHMLAHLGAVHAAVVTMRQLLRRAADEIDERAGTTDDERERAIRALSVRHVVERCCHEIIDRVGRALGPRPLALDAEHARLVAELQLYVRQDHGERDLEALGRRLVQDS
jgi:alkylation response protein AidB-like acyl-CoA dehydrogenase